MDALEMEYTQKALPQLKDEAPGLHHIYHSHLSWKNGLSCTKLITLNEVAENRNDAAAEAYIIKEVMETMSHLATKRFGFLFD